MKCWNLSVMCLMCWIFFSLSVTGCALNGADPSAGDSDARQAEPIRSVQGKADGDFSASCVDNCGGKAAAGCWCDSSCAAYGDCCLDKSEVCDAKPATCEGFCGGKNPAGCWCDEQCAKYGDCCADKAEICETPVDLCAGVNCEVAAPTCDGETLVTTTAASCDGNTGMCTSTTEKTVCPYGCVSDSCQDESVDVFASESCQGPGLSQAGLGALMPAGASKYALADYTLHERVRDCTTLTGCSAWQVMDPISLYYEVWGSTGGPITNPMGELQMRVAYDNTIELRTKHEDACGDIAASCTTTNGWVGCGYDVYGWMNGTSCTTSKTIVTSYRNEARIQLTGKITDHCFWASDTIKVNDNDSVWKEYQVVATATF